MNKEREDKLNELRAKKIPAKFVVAGVGESFIESIESKINELRETLGSGIELNNLDELVDQLEALKSFHSEVKELKESINSIDIPSDIKIVGLESLLEAAKTIADKPEPKINVEKFDPKPITDSIDKLIAQIKTKEVKDQNPSDFTPVRRVVNIGNRLIFDDGLTGASGSGGGGGSSGGLTNTELRASPVPVSATIDTTGLATTATDTNTAAIKTAVEIIDNAISGSEIQADVITLPADPLGANADAAVDTDTTGTISGKLRGLVKLVVNLLSRWPASLGQKTKAGSLPVTLASDEDTVTVDGSAVTQPVSAASLPLPTGAATAANQSTANTSLSNIDTDTSTIATNTTDVPNVIGTDGAAGPTKAVSIAGTQSTGELQEIQVDADGQPQVDVVSSALPSGAATSAKQDTAQTSLDTIAGDTTAIEAGVGATADAAATAGSTGSLSAKQRLMTSQLDAIKTATETIDNAISGSEMQVDVVGALPAGTNAIGKLAANSGVDIGDVDVTSIIPGTGATNQGKAEDGAHTTGDTGVFALGVRQDTPNTATTNTDADYSQISTSSTGAVRTAPMSEDFAALANGPQVKKYYTNAGAVTDGIVWSPAAGKRWYVTDMIINTSAAATVTFEDDKAGGDEVVMKFEFAANAGIAHNFTTPLFSGEDAADLLVTTSAGNCYITVVGYEI